MYMASIEIHVWVICLITTTNERNIIYIRDMIHIYNTLIFWMKIWCQSLLWFWNIYLVDDVVLLQTSQEHLMNLVKKLIFFIVNFNKIFICFSCFIIINFFFSNMIGSNFRPFWRHIKQIRSNNMLLLREK